MCQPLFSSSVSTGKPCQEVIFAVQSVPYRRSLSDRHRSSSPWRQVYKSHPQDNPEWASTEDLGSALTDRSICHVEAHHLF